MNLPKTREELLNAAFVAGLAIFILAFWFFVIPA